MKRNEAKTRQSSSEARTWIWQKTRQDAGFIALLSLLGAFSSACGVSFALLSRQVVDIATGENHGSLLLFSVLLIAVLVLQILLDVASSHLNVWVSGRVEIRIKDGMFGSLFRKRWTEVSAYHSGDLMNRLTNDCQVVVNGVVGVIPQAVSLSTRLIACMAVLVKMDLRIAGVAALVGVLLLLCSRFYGRKMKKLHKRCQEADGMARSMMQESMESWPVIQSFDAGNRVRGQLAVRLQESFSNKLYRNWWGSLAHAAVRLLFSGSYYVALIWSAIKLAGNAISYGTMTAFLQIVSQIRAPFLNISGILPLYYNALASAERLLELELLPEEERRENPDDRAVWRKQMQEIRLENVAFGYTAEQPVLSQVSIRVKRGEFVALTGFSGMGKTTLFRLLLGFAAPWEGNLTLVTSEGQVALGSDTRALFAYVPQQNMLLSGTVRENIAFCCDDVSEEEIWAAAKTADIDETIRRLPNGLDTVLGERGAGLSEGQLQRLAIARAVLSDAPILLLDEATSSLDAASEERVLRRLRDLPDRTCLCISHRPAALALCDRVIHIDNGTVAR